MWKRSSIFKKKCLLFFGFYVIFWYTWCIAWSLLHVPVKVYINELLDFTYIILSKHCTSEETLCEKIVCRVVLFRKLFVQEKGKLPSTEAISEMAFKQGSWTINQCWLWTLTNKSIWWIVSVFFEIYTISIRRPNCQLFDYLKIGTWSQ